MPAGSVDLVVTSPPYNVRQQHRALARRGSESMGRGQGVRRIRRVHDGRHAHAEYVEWQRACP